MDSAVITRLALVGIGGAAGAVLRYAVQSSGLFNADRFWPTVLVNVTGCLLIGIAYALIHQLPVSRKLCLLAVTGLLGGYTTYSTFTFDVFDLLRNGQAIKAAAYFSLTVIGAFIACAVGYLATEKIIRISLQ